MFRLHTADWLHTRWLAPRTGCRRPAAPSRSAEGWQSCITLLRLCGRLAIAYDRRLRRRMIMRASAVVFIASLGSASVGSAQAAHPFSVHDMLAMDRISDPRISPDGKSVAFTVRVTDVEGNRGRTDIWIAGVDGSKPRRLTTHEANDSGARWMPDGKSLVFLSTRGGSSQVWQVRADGGEARALTSLPLAVANLDVFPDGKRLLFTMEVYPDAAPGKEIEETARRDAEREKS